MKRIDKSLSAEFVFGNERKSNIIAAAIVVALSSAAVGLALFFCVNYLVGLEEISVFSFLSIPLLAILMGAISTLNPKFKGLALSILFVFMLIFLFLLRDKLQSGLLYSIGQISGRVNFYYGIELSITGITIAGKANAMMAIPIISMLASFFYGCLVIFRRGFIYCLILGGVILWALTNLDKSHYFLPMLLIALALILSAGNIRQSVKYGFSGINLPQIALLLACAIGGIWITSFLYPLESYDKKNNADAINDILADISKASPLNGITLPGFDGFNIKTDGVSGINFSLSGKRKNSNGKFDAYDLDEGYNATALMIATDIKRPMLLRGYVGTRYTNRGWEPISNSKIRANQEMLNRSNGEGYVEGEYQRLDSRLLREYIGEKASVTIRNVAADDDYSYLPYFFMSDELPYDYKYGYSGAEEITAEGYLYYGASSAAKMRNLDIELSPWENREYLDFIYSSYLELPDIDLSRVKTIAATANNQANPIAFVADYVKSLGSYNANVDKTPYGKDFLSYFLNESREGYCVHFATAATVILREMGIPARYVEGFVVTNNELKSVNAVGMYSIPFKNGHAWTEYYQEGVGWVPLDVTPGTEFARELGVAQSTDSDTSSSEPSSSDISSSEPSSSEISSSKPSSSDTSSSEPAHEITTEKEGLSPVAIAIMSITAAIALFCGLVLLRRKRILMLREKLFLQVNSSAAMIEIYSYAVRLLRFNGVVPIDNESERNFAKRAGEGWFSELTELAVTARYSNDEISDIEIENSIKSVKEAAEKCYKKATFFGKIQLKFIFVLC